MAVGVDPRDVDAIREIVAAVNERSQASRVSESSVRPSRFRHGALPLASSFEELASAIDRLADGFYAAPGDPDCVWHPFDSHTAKEVEGYLSFNRGPYNAIGRDLARASSLGDAAYRLAPWARSRYGRATAGIGAAGPTLCAMREALRRLRRVEASVRGTGRCFGVSPGSPRPGYVNDPFSYYDEDLEEWVDVTSESQAWNLAAGNAGEPGHTAYDTLSGDSGSVSWTLTRKAVWTDLRTEQEKQDAAPRRYGWYCTYQASFDIGIGGVFNATPFAADVDLVVASLADDGFDAHGTGYEEGFNRAVFHAAPAAFTAIPWLPLTPFRPASHPPFPDLPDEPVLYPDGTPYPVFNAVSGGVSVYAAFFDFGVEGGFEHLSPA